MPKWSYLWRELTGRRQRTWINVTLVALSISLFLVLNGAAGSIQSAFRAPLEDVGADLTVQKAGDVPEQMAGPVLPCSVAPVHSETIDRIRAMDGVISVSPALLFWDFGPTDFRVAAGFSPEDPSGFALLKKTLSAGRFLQTGRSGQALLEKSYADKNGLKPGDMLTVGHRRVEVIGLVDSSLLSHLTAAQIYLTLADAREIVFSSKAVQAVHDFQSDDVNLMFIKARRDRLSHLTSRIKEMTGKGTTVSGPQTFRETLGSLFSLTDRFSEIVSILALLVAAVLVARTTATNIQERRVEIGVMKALGWRQRDVAAQLGAETLVQVLAGAVVGLIMGGIAIQMLTLVEISIPIPWDMSPRPHFLPGGGDQLYKTINLPVSISPIMSLYSLLGALGIGVIAVWFEARLMTGMKASEALRYE